MAKTTSKYMLVDGNALIHRGYHAMPGLTANGQPTGAIYGFSLILLKAMAELKPTHVAVTFDLAGPTFRHEAYAEYKAHRVKADQELYDQIPRVKEVVRALNIPIYEKQGFEADDLLGTLATHIHKNNPEAEVMIATGDLDTLQLVNHAIKVYTPRKGITDTVVYDSKAVRERFGLAPEQMVDFRALKGDPSDNIVGVKGIGEKTAAELIQKYGSLDKLYKAVRGKTTPKDIKPRVLELLKENEASARQSYELSTIKCDVPVEINLPEYEFTKKNFEIAFKMFQELEFKSLIPRLPKTAGHSGGREAKADGGENKPAPAHSARIGQQDYRLVDTEQKLQRALEELSKHKELSVDTESDSLNAVEANLVGVGLAGKTGQAFYIPAALLKNNNQLKNLLEDAALPKIGHNLKYDTLVLENAGIKLNNLNFDTMIASYLLNAGTRQHSLDAAVFSELGYRMQPIEELIGKGKTQITMDRVPPEKASWYCGEDVDMTLRLKGIFAPELKNAKLDAVFSDIEMPLVPVLAAMERAGIKLDVKMLNKLAGEAEVEIKQLELDIYKLAGREFNINSPKQIKEVLFDELRIVPNEANRKTKTGLSTAADELDKIRDQHPVVGKILEYRELAKLQSTYLLALPLLVSKKTGRLHTSYSQTVAATGRLSSSDPNLQNIPIRGQGLGSKMRRAFVAERGFKLLSLDYSQIELRIVAHVAQDKKMMDVFRRGEDIHAKTAAEIFNVAEHDVTAEMRRDAKTINFGVLYGLSSFGLSSRIGEVSRAEAKEFIDKYFKAYPRVKEYIDETKREVNEKGFVANQLGRVRRFPEIKGGPWTVRAAAERAAINFPIQSLAADVIKVAMINIYKKLTTDNPPRLDSRVETGLQLTTDCRMLLQVHDELVFEVAEGKVEKWAAYIKPLMENAIKLSIPVTVEAKAGDNWGEMSPLNRI